MFESNSPDHQSIGHMKGAPLGYLEHELAVAKQLFLALQVKATVVKKYILDQNQPGKTGTGRSTFNHATKNGSKVTKYKTCILYYLGMSGKPSWDARLYKKSRKGAAWTNARKEKARAKKKARTEQEEGNKNDEKDNPMAVEAQSQEDKKLPACPTSL
jgi:hypothetical protein